MSRTMMTPRIRAVAAMLCVSAAISTSGCAARPGPAPVEPQRTEEQVSVTPEVPVEKKNRNEVVVGIDPIRTGFNPHLAADDSAFVQSLARLVLPSAFVDGQMNTDVLLSAAEVPPGAGEAQVIQYRINPAAQWSDGSPITGADFRYLWEKMSLEPGVINAAGYQAISDVRSSEGGKLVTVVFSHRVSEWRTLFSNLLPSHLFSVGGESFDKVLATDMPASAGRYMVRTIDRRRGVVELARNDRFWGNDPADVELLTFREISNVSQTIEMLRNGQLSFAHFTPTETSRDALTLAKGLQYRTVDRNVQLTATFNTRSLENQDVRAALTAAVDVPMVAKLAAGRSAELAVVEKPKAEADIASAVAAHPEPIRVAVDPADDTARAAAVAIVDMLNQAGFTAELLQTDMADIVRNRVPEKQADIVVSWRRSPTTALTAASEYSCPKGANETSTISGWCEPDTTAFFHDALAGIADSTAVEEKVSEVETQHLSIPIMADRRIDVLGTGIVTGERELAQWPIIEDASALATAYTWKDN